MLGDDRHTQGEGHVMREAEVGEMKPQAKGCRNCQKAMGSKEEGLLKNSFKSSRGTVVLPALDSRPLAFKTENINGCSLHFAPAALASWYGEGKGLECIGGIFGTRLALRGWLGQNKAGEG